MSSHRHDLRLFGRLFFLFSFIRLCPTSKVAVMITDCGAERDTVAIQWIDRRRRGKEVESEGRGTLRMNTFKAAQVSTQSTGAPLVCWQLVRDSESHLVPV